MANSVDPDEMPHSVASHLGLYRLLRFFCPTTYVKFSFPFIHLSFHLSRYIYNIVANESHFSYFSMKMYVVGAH